MANFGNGNGCLLTSSVVITLAHYATKAQLVLGHNFLMDLVVRETLCGGEDAFAEKLGDWEFGLLITLEDLPENRKVFQFGNPADHANILREIWHVGKQNFTFAS
nr:hypothetical protein [Pseudomonadota bacterium]